MALLTFPKKSKTLFDHIQRISICKQHTLFQEMQFTVFQSVNCPNILLQVLTPLLSLFGNFMLCLLLKCIVISTVIRKSMLLFSVHSVGKKLGMVNSYVKGISHLHRLGIIQIATVPKLSDQKYN